MFDWATKWNGVYSQGDYNHREEIDMFILPLLYETAKECTRDRSAIGACMPSSIVIVKIIMKGIAIYWMNNKGRKRMMTELF